MYRKLFLLVISIGCLSQSDIFARQASLRQVKQLNRSIAKNDKPTKIAKLVRKYSLSKEQLTEAYAQALRSEEQYAAAWHNLEQADSACQATTSDYATGVASGSSIVIGVGALGAGGFSVAMAAMGGLSLVAFAPIAGICGIVGIGAIALGAVGIKSLGKRATKQEVAAKNYQNAQKITQILSEALQ
jgi:hypothetical protein